MQSKLLKKAKDTITVIPTYNQLEEIREWFHGNYMDHGEQYPEDMVRFLTLINKELFNYNSGMLYRFTWIPKEQVDILKKAKNIKIKTGKKILQSWTPQLSIARDFAIDIGMSSDLTTHEDIVVKCLIPGQNILIYQRDLLNYLVSLLKKNSDNEYIQSIASLRSTIDVLKEYDYQKEYIVKLVNPIKVDSIYYTETEDRIFGINDYKKRIKNSYDSPDEVTIILNADGSAKLEYEQNEKLPMAASLLNNVRLG